MLQCVIFAFVLGLAGSVQSNAARGADLDLVVDQTAGVQIGFPRSVPGTSAPTATGLSWKSEDGRLSVATLRFPPTRSLQDIYQRIRSRKGRRTTRDEFSGPLFILEGDDPDGSKFIVKVEEFAEDKRGVSITYNPGGRPDVEALARQIAASFQPIRNDLSPATSAGTMRPQPPANVHPTSESELTRHQRQAIQAQLTAHGHRGAESNGAFGPGTRAAIRSFQRTYNGPETGILTARDLNSLMTSDVYAREIVRLEGRDRVASIDHDPLAPDKCEAVKAEIDAMAKALRVQLEARDVRAGDSIGLSWSFSSQTRRHPMYLIVAFDRPVRFSGAGFYVLSPGARAPFGLAHASDRIRVVVPLYVTGGATSRSIKISAVLAGDFGTDAALVAPSGCGEQVAVSMATTRIAVAPGKPSIEVAEDISLVAPLDTILSPAGDRAIEVTGANTFRLVAKETGQLIMSIAGRQPRFSPTGRFVTSIDEAGVAIRDAVDGEKLSTVASEFSWDNKDSFIIESFIGQGGIAVKFPSVAGDSGGLAGLGCRPCSGVDSTAHKIDLENNLVLSATRFGDPATAIYSLTEELGYSDGMWSSTEDKLKFGSAARFAELVSRVVPITMPRIWEFIEKPQFPYLEAPAAGSSGQDDVRATLSRTGMAPVLRGQSSGQTKAPSSARRSLASLSRNVEALGSDFDGSRRSFAARLKDFGILEQPSIAFEPVEDALKPTRARKSNGRYAYTIYEYKHDPQLRIATEADDCDFDTAKPDRKGLLHLNVQRAVFFATRLGDRRFSLLGGGCLSGSMGYSDSVFALFDSRYPGTMRPITSGVPFAEVRNPGGACEGADCDYHAELSHDRYLVFWSSYSATIEVVDIEKNKTLAFVPFRGDAIERVSLTPDAQMLVQRNKDGTFAVHDLRLGLPVDANSYSGGGRMDTGSSQTAVLFGRYADDEVVVWTPSGHFDATYEGAAQVNLRFAGLSDLYSFDQFAGLMRRPGLADLVLRGEFKDAPAEYKIPPTLSGTIRGDADRVTISIRQTSGKPLSRLLLYQDGLQTNDLMPESGNGVLNLQAKRLAGVRWVSLVAIDADGLASRPIIADIGPGSGARNLRILGVGVDKYVDRRLGPLSFARSDVARVVGAARGAKSRLFDRIEATSFEDENATRQAVMDALRGIVSESSADTDLMLIFAGHGLKGSDGRYYLALTETNTADLQSTALSWDEVARILAPSKARVTVILDSCHSGDAGKDLFSTNDDVAGGLLATAGNVVVLAGSKGREYSLEAASTGGGVFSAAISDTLANAGQTADLDRNGVLEASEMYASVKRFVAIKTQGMQTPWIARNKMIGDFALF